MKNFTVERFIVTVAFTQDEHPTPGAQEAAEAWNDLGLRYPDNLLVLPEFGDILTEIDCFYVVGRSIHYQARIVTLILSENRPRTLPTN